MSAVMVIMAAFVGFIVKTVEQKVLNNVRLSQQQLLFSVCISDLSLRPNV